MTLSAITSQTYGTAQLQGNIQMRHARSLDTSRLSPRGLMIYRYAAVWLNVMVMHASHLGRASDESL